jgi:hypothetical protein
MRWPCGPLEVERARRREGFTDREADLRWCDPRALELLAGSPVNCLVLTWADGSAGDEPQQQALGPLIAAARRRGIALVGGVSGGADLRRAAAAAQAAGLSALAGEAGGAAPEIELLRFRKRGLGDRSPARFLGVTDLVWPGMKAPSEEGVDAATGPTGPPWLDSNAWYVRLARSVVGPKVLWLSFDPPDLGQAIPLASYVQAIADTEVYGARWMVSLDPHLRAGLLDRRAPALEAWAGINRCLAFFSRHRAWAGYEPVGNLGVVSDYAGMNEFLSFEVLNLLARQGSLYRVVEKASALGASLDELDAVLYVDEAPPRGELARKLYAYAEGGGTLITPPGWEERGVQDVDARHPRFRVFRYGRGRLAVAREELSDPYHLAGDAQLLTSHRHDRLRVFNPGSAQFHHTASADGRTGVLHAILFGWVDPRMPTTVWFRRPWAHALAWTLTAEEAAPVARTPVETGVEFHLPTVPIYCALELSS